jgi:phage-related holin
MNITFNFHSIHLILSLLLLLIILDLTSTLSTHARVALQDIYEKKIFSEITLMSIERRLKALYTTCIAHLLLDSLSLVLRSRLSEITRDTRLSKRTELIDRFSLIIESSFEVLLLCLAEC